MRRILVSLISSLALASAFVTAPSATVESEAASASVSIAGADPGRPVLGSSFVVVGRVSPHVIRPLELQRDTGGTWTTVATGRSLSTGDFRMTTVASATSMKFRVVAARVRIGTRTFAKVVSRRLSVTAANLTPTKPAPGQQFTLSGKLQKKVARPVVLQWRDGKAWLTMTKTTSDKHGAFRLTASTALPSILVRPYAPRVKIAKKTYSKYVGPTTLIRTAAAPTPPTPDPLAIATRTVPAAVAGVAYTATLQATGGAVPYAWTATGLPTGITLDAATGKLAGTTTVLGAHSLSVTLTDQAGTAITKQLSLSVLTGKPRQVAGGRLHTCLLTEEGTVYCWGANGSGQLGDGTLSDRPTPRLLPGLTGVTQIAVGWDHTCALVATEVFCWGLNFDGQAGPDDDSNPATPSRVTGLSGVTQVAAGSSHTCAVTDGGQVSCWGSNFNGELGYIGPSHSSTPHAVDGLTGAVAVAAGDGHSCAILDTGDATCWGLNSHGQLGAGSVQVQSNAPLPVDAPGSPFVAIVAGGDHTCALTDDGSAWCWGQNADGEVGNNSTSDLYQPARVADLTGATAITAGRHHSCALRGLDGISCWGNGRDGQLGAGATEIRHTATAVLSISGTVAVGAGGAHTCAITTTTGVLCWGNNQYGQLGTGGTGTDPVTAPVTVVGFGN